MHIIDQIISPTADFESNSPVCLGETAIFTFTGDPGVPAGDFLWDFGDGVTSTLMYPTHDYAAAGPYTVTLEVCNQGGCDSASALFEVLPLPTAGFTYDAAGLTVTFNNTSQDATAYQWDFGDGGTSTETHPVYTYAAEGTYTVTLEAFSDCGSDTFVEVITVVDIPIPSFEHNAPVCLGEVMVFTNTSSGADTYLWDFGDGITSTLEHPTHTYAAAGTYTVTLEACNATTCTMALDTVEVLPLPMASFIYAADGFTVTFTNTSMYASAYLWNFGDGSTSTETHPVHVYTATGTYTVTLEATGVCGVDSIEMAITVEEPGPTMYYLYLPLITKNFSS
jgi:PKD repeat protein